MFWRKKILIRELRAANETNKITIRMQDETIQKYMKLAEERGASLRELPAQLEVARRAHREELDAASSEIATLTAELQKTQEKLLALQEEAREEASRKQREAAREEQEASLSEVNSSLQEKPELKASTGGPQGEHGFFTTRDEHKIGNEISKPEAEDWR